nr:uncharacterized protein LOC111503447 [Leptinotarsa decemlineata]
MVSDSEITHLVKMSLENNEHLREIIVNIPRHSKVEGCIGEIIFVNANGIAENNERKYFELAVKYLRNDRKRIESAIYSTVIEFNMYNRVLPSLQMFLSENGLMNELYFIPKQYECIVSNIENVIIMENLKYTGYKLHDKKKNMNMFHIKMVIQKYAKLHAVSFAFRKQKTELFQELTKVLVEKDTMKHAVIYCTEMRESTLNNLDTALKIFKENGDEGLHHLLRTAVPKHPCDVLWDILNTEEMKTALCHGDSWNNNYLFKYKKDDCTEPIGVKIIDWQLSGIRIIAIISITRRT